MRFRITLPHATIKNIHAKPDLFIPFFSKIVGINAFHTFLYANIRFYKSKIKKNSAKYPFFLIKNKLSLGKKKLTKKITQTNRQLKNEQTDRWQDRIIYRIDCNITHHQLFIVARQYLS